MSNRQEYNRKIASQISEMIEKCPDLRFIQILWALGIINHEDRFYEESDETSKIVDENINRINEHVE